MPTSTCTMASYFVGRCSGSAQFIGVVIFFEEFEKKPQPVAELFKVAQIACMPMEYYSDIQNKGKPSLKWDGAIKTDESPMISQVLDERRRVLASHRAAIEKVAAMALDAMDYAQNASDMRRIGDYCSTKLDLSLDNASAAARGIAEAR